MMFVNTKRVGTLPARRVDQCAVARGWVMKGSFVAAGSTGETLIPTAFTAAGFKEAEGGLSVMTMRGFS